MCTSIQCSRGKILVRYTVPETKFKGSEEETLGQLIVTPEVVASKIKI